MESRESGSQDESAAGLKSEVTSFLKDSTAYLQLRSQLFSIEAKEAGLVYRKKSKLLLAGLAVLSFAYGLLIVALIGLVGQMLDANAEASLGGWIGATLIFSFIHLLIGLFIYFKGRKYGAGQVLFEYTRNELQKEQEWVKETKTP